jgi:TonB family protein
MKTNKTTESNGAARPHTFLLRRFYFIILALAFSVLAQAQSDTAVRSEIEIFQVVEKMPEFVGGKEALSEYLNANAVYSQATKDACIMGTVYVTFVVEADGSIEDAKVLRGIHPDLDSISLELVNRMPNLNPGEFRGNPIRVQYSMPIHFGFAPGRNGSPPEMSKYWSKKGKESFFKTCQEQYGKSWAECNCWFNFIIWNYNDKTLKSIDLDEIFKSQKCK